jgi:hypothetical protein
MPVNKFEKQWVKIYIYSTKERPHPLSLAADVTDIEPNKV